MAPLLSLSQIQAMRALRMSVRSNPIKQEQPCSTALTLSAVGCKSLKLLLREIKAAKKDRNIVTLKLEQVLGRGRDLDRSLFEALENLLLCDNRAWHRMKFVDTIQVNEFDYWREQKKAMLCHVENIAEKSKMSVRLRLVVKVPCDTKTSNMISFLKGLLADKTIKTLMISGALKYKDPTEAWKQLARIFRYPETWNNEKEENESAMVEFHIFYDGVEGASATQEAKSWSSDLKHCIRALERRGGTNTKRTSSRKRTSSASQGDKSDANSTTRTSMVKHSSQGGRGRRKPSCSGSLYSLRSFSVNDDDHQRRNDNTKLTWPSLDNMSSHSSSSYRRRRDGLRALSTRSQRSSSVDHEIIQRATAAMSA